MENALQAYQIAFDLQETENQGFVINIVSNFLALKEKETSSSAEGLCMCMCLVTYLLVCPVTHMLMCPTTITLIDVYVSCNTPKYLFWCVLQQSY